MRRALEAVLSKGLYALGAGPGAPLSASDSDLHPKNCSQPAVTPHSRTAAAQRLPSNPPPSRASRLRMCEVNRHWRAVLLASGLWSRVELEWPAAHGLDIEEEARATSMQAYCSARAQVRLD